MMAGVACFCGRFFSFEGTGQACPECGEYARVAAEPAQEGAIRSRPGTSWSATNGAGQPRRMTFPEWIGAGAIALSGGMVGAGARDPRTGPER
jgi:hypothetical protein